MQESPNFRRGHGRAHSFVYVVQDVFQSEDFDSVSTKILPERRILLPGYRVVTQQLCDRGHICEFRRAGEVFYLPYQRIRPLLVYEFTEVAPSLPSPQALVFLDRCNPRSRGEPSLPALAAHNPDAVRPLTQRMKTDDIDIAVDGILLDDVLGIVRSRAELYIVDCEAR